MCSTVLLMFAISLFLKMPAAFLVSDLKFLDKEAATLPGYTTITQTADTRNRFNRFNSFNFIVKACKHNNA